MTEQIDDGFAFDLPKNRSSVIKVIGVGGGGSNAVNYMKAKGINGVDFIVCNTDSQALAHSPVENKIQLGVNLTEGLGAGANPEVGEKAAQENIDDIRQILSKSTKMLFITAGMGGGTGTGAAPVIAKVAQEMGILTVGIVTIPFKFEGSVREKQAEKGINQLREYLDSLIVINNNKLREVYGNLGFKAGFSKADEVLATAAKSIAEVITHHYTTNIDLKDARTVLAASGTAIMGSSTASGQDRAINGIKSALDSPLLNDNNIYGAKNVLLLIVSGEGQHEITLDEIGEITDYIQNEAGGGANVIMGVGQDDTLDEEISITVVATGFPPDQQVTVINHEPKKIIHTLEPEQRMDIDFKEEEKPVKKEVRRTQVPPQPNLFDIDEPEEKPEAPEPKPTEVPLPPGMKEEAPEEEFQKLPVNEEDFVIYDLEDEEIEDSKLPASENFEKEKHSQQAQEQEEEKDEKEPAFMFSLEDDIEETVAEDTQEPEAEKEPEPTPIEKNEQRTVYSLEDFEELKSKLDTPKFEKTEEKPTAKQPKSELDEDAFQIKVKTEAKRENMGNDAEDFSDPFDKPLSSVNNQRSQERMSRLKAYQHQFKSAHKNLNEEKVPAYKRMGVDLDKPSDNGVSRMTLNDEDGPQLRSNNSFLHDNVD